MKMEIPVIWIKMLKISCLAFVLAKLQFLVNFSVILVPPRNNQLFAEKIHFFDECLITSWISEFPFAFNRDKSPEVG